MATSTSRAALALLWLGACGGDAASGAGDDGGAQERDGGVLADAASADASRADAASGTDAASVDGGADAGTDGADGGCANTPNAPPGATGCASTRLYALPDDPSARGPWPVGAKTVTIQGLVTEVWYPAKLGSDQCKSPVAYDLRKHLPPSEQAKIPDADNPLQICDCYADLPLDDAHGPYPVISFIHGTAAFRTQSLTFATHWASRGFVVVASDHPHIQLADLLAGNFFGADQTGDAVKVLAALDAPTGDLAFLAGHLDMTRIGASGHSAGGQAVAGIASRRAGIRVVVPMAAGGTTRGGDLASTLVMSAAHDGIAQPSGQVNGYGSSSPKKRFVQIDRAGHLAFSDLCAIGASSGGLLAVAVKYDVNGASTLASLANDGCPWQMNANYTAIRPEQGWAIVDYATSAAFEEVLMCNAAMGAKLTAIKTPYPLVIDYREQLQ